VSLSFIILKNNTPIDIFIEDLGIQIDSSASLNLLEIFTKEEVSNSDNVLTNVANGNFTVNDGTQDLSISNGIKHVTIQTEWEDLEEIPPHSLDDHLDVPTKPTIGDNVLQCDDGTNTWIITPPTINSLDDINGVPTLPTTGDNFLRIKDGIIMWGNSPTSSSVVQIRRSTQYSDIPLSWTDFYFDQTDIETNPNIIEHDDSNKDRILIKEDGLYQIGYHFDFDDQVDARVSLNDTLVINGSERFTGEQGDVNDFQGVCANVFYANLSENDFITLQVMASSSAENIIEQATMIISKMEGVAGSPGPPGGTVEIKDENVQIVEYARTLNFTGGVDITADSTSSVTINISGVPIELPSVEARRTTVYNCTTTFTDITFDQTDVENYPSVIYHDDINTERIYVKEDGIYCIYYKSQMISSGTTRRSEARVQKNDTTTIPSSEGFLNSYQNEIHHITDIFIAELNADDFISLQLRSTTTPVASYPPTVFGIFKLKGSKGDKGDKGDKGEPGSGAAPNIYKDDSLVVANSDAINFEGTNINVTADSTSKVTITVTEGSYTPKVIQCVNEDNYNINNTTPIRIDWTNETYKDSDYYTHSTSSNTSRIYVLNSGLYKITYSVNYSGDNSRKNIRTRIRINGSTYQTIGLSYSYTRNNSNSYGNNNASCLLSLSANDYFEIMADQVGDSGDADLIEDESWVMVEFIK